MTTTHTRHRDLPRVLPADPSWITTARHLPEVLYGAARAADLHRPGAYLLDGTAYWVAAETIETLIATVTHMPNDDGLQLVCLPHYKLRALELVHAAVQRALDGIADAARLLDLLQLLLHGRKGTPAMVARDLDRILVVLSLDAPAVYTIASAHVTGRRGDSWNAACREIASAWRTANVTL